MGIPAAGIFIFLSLVFVILEIEKVDGGFGMVCGKCLYRGKDCKLWILIYFILMFLIWLICQ
jgi:hypothetical protein